MNTKSQWRQHTTLGEPGVGWPVYCSASEDLVDHTCVLCTLAQINIHVVLPPRLGAETYNTVKARGSAVDAGLLMLGWVEAHPQLQDPKGSKFFAPIGPWQTAETEEETRTAQVVGEIMRQNCLVRLLLLLLILYFWPWPVFPPRNLSVRWSLYYWRRDISRRLWTSGFKGQMRVCSMMSPY